VAGVFGGGALMEAVHASCGVFSNFALDSHFCRWPVISCEPDAGLTGPTSEVVLQKVLEELLPLVIPGKALLSDELSLHHGQEGADG